MDQDAYISSGCIEGTGQNHILIFSIIRQRREIRTRLSARKMTEWYREAPLAITDVSYMCLELILAKSCFR